MIGLLVVLAANLRFLEGMPQVLDPMMSMDPFYIDLAHQPLSSILSRDPAWGPLYALWLKPFVAILGDPLRVYVANVGAISLALSFAIFVHGLVVTRRAVLATALALFFLVSDFNVPLFSKVSAFALLLLLIGLTLAQLASPGPQRLTVASFAAVIAAWARPELLPAGVCLALTAGWTARRRGQPSPRRLLLVAAAVLLFCFSGHTADAGEDRLLQAFREHFMWNWSRWHGEWRYLADVWREEFGDANSLLGALAHNPAGAFHHFADNLIATVRFLAVNTCGHFPLLAPATWPTLVELESIAAGVAMAAVVLASFADRDRRRALFEHHGDLLLAYGTIALSCSAAAIVIFPRPHYLAIPAILLWLAAMLAASVRVSARASSPWMIAATALAAVAMVPRPFVLPSVHQVPGSAFVGRFSVTRPLHDTVELVRSFHLPPPVRVLTLNDGVGEMLGDGYQEIKIWRRGDRPLADYIRDNEVAVVVTMEAGRESFLIDDPHWRRLLTNPESTGFVRRAVPGNPNVGVYLRRDLAG